MNAFGREILRRRLVGQPPHLHVAESVIGKTGFERLHALPAENQQSGLIAPAGVPRAVLRIQRAVGLQHLVELQLDGLSPLAPHPRLDPAGEVLAEIHQIDPGRGLYDPFRRQLPGHAHRRHRVRRQTAQRSGNPADRPPQAVAESDLVPAVHGPGVVDRLARPDAVVNDLAVAPPPRAVGGDHLARTRFVLDDDIQPHLRRRAPVHVVHAEDIPRRRAVPAVAQHDAHGIAPRRQPVRNVVGRIHHPLVVIGEQRVQDPVADLAAVDIEFVIAQSADESRRPADRRGQLHLPAHIYGGTVLHEPVLPLGPPVRLVPAVRQHLGETGGHPLPLPVELVEQPGPPRCHRTPVRFGAVRVPHLHLPIVIAAGQQRNAPEFHMLAPPLPHDAGVPYIAAVRLQQLPVRSDQHPVGSLQIPGSSGVDPPAQRRTPVPHAERLLRVIAGQPQRAGIAGGGRSGRNRRKEKCQG